MNGNTLFKSPAAFFISRFLILIGMVLVFTSVCMVLAFFLVKPLFGVDALQNAGALSDFTNPNVVNALKLVQVLGVAGAFIIPALYFPKAISQQPAIFLQLRKPYNPLQFIIPVVILFISMPMISWLVSLNEGIQFPASMADFEQRLKAAEESAVELTKVFMHASSTGMLLINMFVIAVMPAIAEELLFRGAVLQFIRYCFKNIHVAVFASAIIFSAFHGQFYGFIPRMVLGLVLGYIFVYSGSIWPGMLIHFLNNAIALLIAHNHWGESSLLFLKEDYVFPLYITAFSIAATVALIWAMRKWYQPVSFNDGE